MKTDHPQQKINNPLFFKKIMCIWVLSLVTLNDNKKTVNSCQSLHYILDNPKSEQKRRARLRSSKPNSR